MTLNYSSISNPNPVLGPPLKTPSSHACFSHLPSTIFESFHRQPRQRAILVANGLSLAAQSNRSWVRLASSHDDSPLEVDIDQEENDTKPEANKSEEAWEQTLASFKEQALKLQSVSQEAYEVYSKKAAVVLRETAETLKIQADKARYDLSIVAKEISEEGRQYLATAAENSPEPVKDVMETFATADDLNDVSKVRDFFIGIPYGVILSVGGFLNFMLTGSISALRFGVILGGTLLALSVSSLRSWRKGESSDLALKGQAAIAGILFLRDARLLCHGLSIAGLVKAIISGAVTTFLVYWITYDKQQGRSSLEGETQS